MKHYIEYSKDIYQDKIFISYNNQEITFNDFYHNVCSKSRALNFLNISNQSIVGIFLSNPIDILEIYFSCLQLNKTPIIFPSDVSNSELQKIVKTYNIKFIITEWIRKNQIQLIKGIDSFYIQELSSSYGGCAAIDFQTNIDEINTVQSMHLTSGSTGTPKLIKLTFSNFINSVTAWDREIQFSNSDKYIQCLPLNHIAGLSIIMRSQIKGFQSILMNKFNASKINFEIDNGATLISLIPSMLKRLLDDRLGRSFPDGFKGIIIGGDGCSKRLIQQAVNNNIPIYKSYGMTETSSGISGFWVHQHPDMVDSVGKSFKNTRIKISNNRVMINGPTVTPYGYDGNNNNTILTTDTGILKNRFLFITGRCDDIVISGGENISLSNIKNILFQNNDIIDVYLDTEKHDDYGTKITAFVQVTKEELSSEDIYKHLMHYLSKNQCPQDIQIVDEINHD